MLNWRRLKGQGWAVSVKEKMLKKTIQLAPGRLEMILRGIIKFFKKFK